MAHLWKRMTDSDEWTPIALDGDAFALADSSLALRRVEAHPVSTWALLAAPGTHVLVNGTPVNLGIIALADRDEIRFANGAPTFFSTEVLAETEPFPASGARGFCPRCKQQIEAATPAVRCPSCGLWHHASDELPCWTYAPQCSACPQATALEAGFRWTPEDL